MFRKTKIICTLGPSTEEDDILKQLMLEGMNVARFNFSHGDYASHEKNLNRLKKLRDELKLPVAALLDTKGPEVRIGDFKDGKVELKKGQTFTLTIKDVEGDETRVSVTYKKLLEDISIGATILLDDGLIELKVLNLTETDIICNIENGGIISNKKGVNIPNVDLTMPFISEKDYNDIVFGIEQEFDFIAASFTRSAADILEIRKILSEHNCNRINIIAKIENIQGVNNIDEIIRVSDGVMVARGDMGVEIPLEDVPILQKMIIEKVADADKVVITATQMLESMMKNPRPTRAEATDIANAIYDGTSAIMLSGETAAGMYPVQALKTMVRIATRTEQEIDYWSKFTRRNTTRNTDVTNAISHATCTTAIDLRAAAIIAVTVSGKTASMVSKYRPSCPIIVCSPSQTVCRQMGLYWGVLPLVVSEVRDTDALFQTVVDEAEKAGYVKQGEVTVITAGVPLGMSGTTNLIKVQVVGHILVKGKGIGNGFAQGTVCVAADAEELEKRYHNGDIVVTTETSNAMLAQLRSASAIVVENGSLNSHASIVGLSLDIPVIIYAKNAMRILKPGTHVTVDAKDGTVCCGN